MVPPGIRIIPIFYRESERIMMDCGSADGEKSPLVRKFHSPAMMMPGPFITDTCSAQAAEV
jgi:hypothetical protein